jgi:hypothetical protein
MSDTTALVVKMNLDSWNSYLKRTDDLFNELSDEQLQAQIAPGRNRGVYLLGHLTAVNDRLLPLMGFGEPLHPELFDTFLVKADDAGNNHSVTELRSHWKEVNEKLQQHLNTLSPDEWLQKHTSVSAEDFAKEPHRNRLNVLISRTGHMAGHHSQLLFLKNKG